MVDGQAGKGDHPRPCATGKEEYDLRWKLFNGEITMQEFDEEFEKLRLAGKIVRGF